MNATPRRSASVGRASGVMALGTLASRLTGMLRTVALAALGLNALTDVYTKANNVPNMVYELVAGGVLSATLVPLFATLLRRDTRRAHEGIDAIISLVAVTLVLTSVLAAIASPWLMRVFLHEPDQIEVATRLFRFFAPQIAVYGWVTVATAMLNVRRRFFAPMFAPVLNNLVVIVVLVWVGRLLRSANDGAGALLAISHDTTTLVLLGAGTTLGVLAMGLAFVPAWRSDGVPVRWHWEPSHPAVREMIRLSAWTFGYVASNMAALLFVMVASGKLVDGSYAAYTIAYGTYFLLPHGLFAVSIATALQPELSEAFIERRRKRFRSVLARGMGMQVAVMLPAAVGYVVLARPIVTALSFGRSANPRSIEMLSSAVQAFAFGLPAFSLYLLLMNACKAMRDTRITFIVNAAENAANIVFAAFSLALGLGVRGLAASFAFAYVVGLVYAAIVVSRRLDGLDVAALADTAGRVFAASLAMGGAVLAVRLGVEWLLGDGRTGSIVQVGAGVVAGVTVYAIAARSFGVSEIATLTSGIARRLTRRAA